MTDPKEKNGKREPVRPPEPKGKGSIRDAIEKLRQDLAARLPSSQDTGRFLADHASEEHVGVMRKGTRKGYSEVYSGERGNHRFVIGSHMPAPKDYSVGSRCCKDREPSGQAPDDDSSVSDHKSKEDVPDAVVKLFRALCGPFKEGNRLRKVFDPVPVSVPFLKGDAGLSTRGELLSAYERPAGKAKLQNHWVVYEEINGSFYSLRGKIPGKLIDVTHPDGKPGKAVVAVRNPATEKEEIMRDKDGNPCVLFHVDEALKPIIWFPPRDQDEPKG